MSDMLAPGAMPMPPTCAASASRDVVAVEVERRDHAVLVRAQQDLLQERVGDDVLDDDVSPVFGFLNVIHGPPSSELRAELASARARSPSRGTRPR